MREISFLLLLLSILGCGYAKFASERRTKLQSTSPIGSSEIAANSKMPLNSLLGERKAGNGAGETGVSKSITSSSNLSDGTIGDPASFHIDGGSITHLWSLFHWNRSDRHAALVIDNKTIGKTKPADVAISNTAGSHLSALEAKTSSHMDLYAASFPDNWVFLCTPNVDGVDYPNVGQIIVDSEDKRILYVMVYRSGLFVSRDGGVSWEVAVLGEPPLYGVIAKDHSTVDRVFYGQHNKLYVSSDRGLTWNLLYTFDPEYYCESIVVSKLNPHTIYIAHSGSNVEFYRSDDDGATWRSYSYEHSVGIENFRTWALAEDPIDGTLYLGIELGNHPQPYRPPFMRSIDGGMTWENLVENMTSLWQGPIWHVTSIVVHPENHKVYALSEGVGVYTSVDKGLTWNLAQYPELIVGLVRDPNQEGRLFAGSVFYGNRPGGIHISEDDAQTFSQFGLQGITAGSFELAGNSRFLFAAAYQSGIWVTRLSEERKPARPRARTRRETRRDAPAR